MSTGITGWCNVVLRGRDVVWTLMSNCVTGLWQGVSTTMGDGASLTEPDKACHKGCDVRCRNLMCVGAVVTLAISGEIRRFHGGVGQ